jgi:CBS domain-containing protein
VARQAGEQGEERPALERVTPEAITQSTSIEEADQLLSIGPVIVEGEASLQAIAERAVENPGCRVIAVVDDDRRLSGVIPVRTLVNDIFLNVLPELFLGEIGDLDAALRYAAHLGARTAADIALPPASVRSDDSVREAFRLMHDSKLNGLPIVDAASRVVGYVDQLELLIVWIKATGREGLVEPPDHDDADA